MMNNYPKILLACPVSNIKDYILWKWIDYVKGLSYPNYDILLVDNSHDINYRYKIQKQGVKCWYSAPGKYSAREYMCMSNQMIRSYFLQGKYDYLFSLECDIFPPHDIIERLLQHKKEAVSGIYFIEYGKHSRIMAQVVQDPKVHGYTNLLTRNWTQEESFMRCDGTLKRVFNPGLGCMLIKKDVLEKINFRIDEDQSGHADSFFASDLFQEQIPVWLDTATLCRHYNDDWSHIVDNYKQ